MIALLSLPLLLPLVIAGPVIRSNNPSPSAATSTHNGCSDSPSVIPRPGFSCAAHGHIRDQSELKRFNSPSRSWHDCYHSCASRTDCASFSYNRHNERCRLFRELVERKGFWHDSSSPVTFWDLHGCFDTPKNTVSTSAHLSTSASKLKSTVLAPVSTLTSSHSGFTHTDAPSSSSGSMHTSAPTKASGMNSGSSRLGASSHPSRSPSTSGGLFSPTASSSSGLVSSGDGGSSSSNGTTGVSGTPNNGSSYGGQSLLPAVHWNYPIDDIENLKPGNATQLYYSSNGVSDPSVEHLFATLNATLQYETVILDHSVYVKTTSCDTNGIRVTFVNATGFNYAARSWASVPHFVLVTYTDGCGASADQRTFWLIDSITPDPMSDSVVCHVKDEIAIEDCLDEVELVWGAYQPTGSPSSPESGPAGGSPSGAGPTPNGTTPSNGGLSCGVAPSPTIDGFPAANCGDPNFDATLDSTIGFLDFSSSDYTADVEDFAPGISFDSADLTYDSTDQGLGKRANLHKRGWFSSAASFFVKTVVTVATAPLQLVQTAVKNIPVIGDLAAKATEISPSISGTADFKLGPDNKATSPWGDAALIYTKESSKSRAQADLNLYCVDCGVRGHASLYGAAKWNAVDNLKSLNANLKANLEAGLNLGLVATATFSDTRVKPLIRQAVPELGVAVKGVFSAGCFVAVDAKAKLNIAAEGQALVGVTMSFPNFEANLNLLDENNAASSTITGYTPEFKKRFEAAGTISATTTLSLPISFNVGIEIVPVKFKRTVALIEEPGITGTLTYAGSTTNAGAASTTCNNGFEYSVNVQNDISMDFLGLKTFNLNHYQPSTPILSGCKLLEGSATTTTDATATSDVTATTDATVETDVTAATDATPTTNAATIDASTGTDIPSALDDPTPTENPAKARVRRTFTTHRTVTSATTTPTAAASSPSTSNIVITNDGEDEFGSNPNDLTDQTSSPVDSDSESPDNPEFDANSSSAEALADAATNEDGFTFTTIQDTHGTFTLMPGVDGNLYPGNTDTASDAALFGIYTNNTSANTPPIAAIDSSERILHYYPDTMAKYGASRIRLSSEAQIPKTADMIVLKPVDTDGDAGTPAPLFAVDTRGTAYALVVCNFGNGATSKVLIVNGEQGLENLEKDEKLRYTVTGAAVKDCEGISMVFRSS